MTNLRRAVSALFCLAVISGAAPQIAKAFPLAHPSSQPQQPERGQAFQPAFGQDFEPAFKQGAALATSPAEIEALGVDFTAIVALNNCSGALIRFTTSRPQDQALVLTNGHCYEGGFMKSGIALTDQTSARTFKLLNAAGTDKIATFHAERLVYATMTGTDIALYRTSKTYADLKEETGVEALPLSPQHPEKGAPARVVSGYWKKIYTCNVQKFIPILREGNWDSFDSIKFSQPGCETIGGTSGSPLIHAVTHEVIGINNTGNDNGESCTDENPCEIDEAGKVVVEKGAAYGQQTYQIYTCLRPDNTLDLTLPGCKLLR